MLALSLGGWAIPALAASDTELTLQQSIELALQNNASYTTTRLTYEGRSAGLKEARQRTAPAVTVKVNAASDRFEDSLGTEFVLSLGQSTDEFPALFSGGSYPRALTSVEQAGLTAEQAALKLRKAKADLVYSVTQTYIALLKARSLVEVEESNLTVAQAARKDAELKLSAGIGTNLDVLRADLEVANAESALAKARNSVALAEADFFATLGAKPSTGTVRLAEPPPAIRPPGSVETLAEQAVKVRPEVADAELSVKKTASALNAARREKLPTLRLSADYTDEHLAATTYWELLDGQAGWSLDLKPSEYASQMRVSGSTEAEWRSTLGLTYPLYDSGVQNSVIQQRELDLKTAEVARAQAIASVQSEVLSASLALDEAIQREAAMEKALQQATEAQRLTELRVTNGVGTTSELLDANQSLGEARVNRLQARYDSRLALAKLLKATGTDEEERS